MLTRMAGLVLAVVLLVSITRAEQAVAEPGEGCSAGGTQVSVGLKGVCLTVKAPGIDGGAGSPGRPGNGGSAEKPAGCFKSNGTEVPCQTDDGYWWSGSQCYAKPYDAPAGTPAWQGHTDGSLWQCTSCASAGTTTGCHVQIVWAAPGTTPTPPSPGQLAKTALGEIHLAQAEVHTAPQAPDPTYVGIANWLWIPDAQWATLTKSVTAGPTTVTATAAPSQVLWKAGPESATCYDAGRPWVLGMTDAATTRCSITFDQDSTDQPNDSYAITATIRYAVTWSCSGTCSTSTGDLGLVDAPAGAGELRVLQRQTVVVR